MREHRLLRHRLLQPRLRHQSRKHRTQEAQDPLQTPRPEEEDPICSRGAFRRDLRTGVWANQ